MSKHRDIGQQWCPGSRQNRVNFCSSKEGSWLGPGSFSVRLHTVSGGRGKGLSPGKKGFWSGRGYAAEGDSHYFLLSGGLSELIFLFPFAICCCYGSFSYLIAVLSKLFSCKPMIFDFCTSNCPLQNSAGRRKGRNPGSETAVHGLESLDGGIALESTIPKSQQAEGSILPHSRMDSFLPFSFSFIFFFLSDLHFDLSSEFLRIDPYYYEEQCFHRF